MFQGLDRICVIACELNVASIKSLLYNSQNWSRLEIPLTSVHDTLILFLDTRDRARKSLQHEGE